jgi:hypothetical protein
MFVRRYHQLDRVFIPMFVHEQEIVHRYNSSLVRGGARVIRDADSFIGDESQIIRSHGELFREDGRGTASNIPRRAPTKKSLVTAGRS